MHLSRLLCPGTAILLAALAAAIPSRARGADASADVVLDDVDWELALEAEDEDALDELMREAASYRANPVDVNRASVSALMRVPFLDPVSAVRIAAHVRGHGPVASLDLLVRAGCLEEVELERVRPYLRARILKHESDPFEIGPSPLEADADGASGPSWDLRVRASLSESTEDSWAADGAAARAGTFARLRVSYGSLELGLACEKDIGETSLTDHTAASLIWRAPGDDEASGPLRSAGLGDMVGSWGQGLLLRSGGFPSVSGYPRMADALRGYSGAGESSSRRGGFVELERGAVTVRVLAASTALDASLDERGLVSSIRSTGHHRTEGEVAGAGVLRETAAAARVTASLGHAVEASASLLRASYSPGIAPGDPIRQHFRFSGDAMTAAGLDARVTLGDVRLGCELASKSDGGLAGLAAARLRAGRATMRTGLACLSRDYWSPMGSGAPGFSGGSNGMVAWVGAEYRSGRDWKAWTDCMVKRRLWRSYHLEMPDGSTTAVIGAEARAGALGRLRLETKLRSFADEDGDNHHTVERRHSRIKLSLDSAAVLPTSLYWWRTVASTGRSEDGALSAAGARVSEDLWEGCSVTLGLTSAVRRGSPPLLFQYEPGLPGEFGLRSLNASGVRWYIRARAGLPAGLVVTARAAGGPGRGQTEFGVGIDAGGL